VFKKKKKCFNKKEQKWEVEKVELSPQEQKEKLEMLRIRNIPASRKENLEGELKEAVEEIINLQF